MEGRGTMITLAYITLWTCAALLVALLAEWWWSRRRRAKTFEVDRHALDEALTWRRKR